MDTPPGCNIFDQVADSCWVEVGPVSRVQAILKGAAKLGTEAVARGSWCNVLQVMNNELFNVAYLLRMLVGSRCEMYYCETYCGAVIHVH